VQAEGSSATRCWSARCGYHRPTPLASTFSGSLIRSCYQAQDVSCRITRLVYVGAASFEDTFIREAAEWVRRHPDVLSLHVTGDNVAADVWEWLESLDAANITTDRKGVDYRLLPSLLSGFDAGLVLYKGNTLNFVHNVPNKATEYLACGLETWYPAEMEGMRAFHESHDDLPMRQLDFRALPSEPPRARRRPVTSFELTCESALEPLIAEINRVAGSR
jgi:hypothetical protein